jgi:hypothetical protein
LLGVWSAGGTSARWPRPREGTSFLAGAAHHAKTAYARTVESIKANARQAGKLQQQLVDYFGCPFEDLSEILLVDPKTESVCLLEPNLNDALVYKLRRPLRVTIAA